MSEHPEQGEQSAPAAPMPATADPSQETPTLVGAAPPAFASADDEARRPDADPSDPGVPASTLAEAPEAAPAAPQDSPDPRPTFSMTDGKRAVRSNG